MPRSKGWFALRLVLVLSPLILFAFFMASSVRLGGEAFGGKIVDGHYFVSNHGKFTEVSREAFLFSLWLGRITIASFIAMAVVSLSNAVCQSVVKTWQWLSRK
jgi:hypothetical protein